MKKENRHVTPRTQSGHKSIIAKREFFAGPLPHPSTLEGYEKVCPGAADRIIAMAENQSKHRQSIEKSVVESNIRNEAVGMVLSFILTAGIIAGAMILIYNNKSVEGIITLCGVVGFQAWNYRQVKKKEDQHDKE